MTAPWQYTQQEMPSEQYHSRTHHVSNSMLSVFLRSRREYEAYYVAKTHDPPGATKAMQLGTVAHAAILEPHILDDVCMEIPARVLTAQGHRRGKAWTEFRAEHADRILLNSNEMKAVRGMFAAVYANPIASRVLTSDGPTEASIFWTCAESGTDRRCRLDKLALPFVCDVKTIAELSPQAFARSAARFGYHRQAAYYMDGVKAMHGQQPTFLFAAVCTKPPYRCHVYQLDEAAIDLGRAAVRDGLTQLRACQEHDDWFDPEEGQITDVGLPAWAFSERQYECEVA